MTTGERRLLHVAAGATSITGVTVWVMKDLLPRRDPFSVLGHPWQPHVLAAHLLVAPTLVFALGLIYREHIVQGWRYGRSGDGRRSGLLTVLGALPMILSGYLLQVVTGDLARHVLSIGHLVTGLLFTGMFLAHLVRAWRRRATAPAEAPAVTTPTSAPTSPRKAAAPAAGPSS